MDEEKLIEKEKPKKLVQVEQLIDECNLDEADQLIRNFEEKGGHTLYDLVDPSKKSQFTIRGIPIEDDRKISDILKSFLPEEVIILKEI